jgi:hypothetical protein
MKLKKQSLKSTTNNGKGEGMSEQKEWIVVPEGRYLAKIRSVSEKTSETTGSKFLKVMFEITKGEYKEKSVSETLLLEHSNEKALEVAKDKAGKLGRALGIKINEVEDLLSPEFIDQELIINTVNREYEGKVFSNVRKYEEGI